VFEKKSEEEFSREEKQEAYLFYENLENKEQIYFKIYTECYTTLEPATNETNGEVVRMWVPFSLDSFLEKFRG
jgi:hypothetical protein